MIYQSQRLSSYAHQNGQPVFKREQVNLSVDRFKNSSEQVKTSYAQSIKAIQTQSIITPKQQILQNQSATMNGLYKSGNQSINNVQNNQQNIFYHNQLIGTPVQTSQIFQNHSFVNSPTVTNYCRVINQPIYKEANSSHQDLKDLMQKSVKKKQENQEILKANELLKAENEQLKKENQKIKNECDIFKSKIDDQIEHNREISRQIQEEQAEFLVFQEKVKQLIDENLKLQQLCEKISMAQTSRENEFGDRLKQELDKIEDKQSEQKYKKMMEVYQQEMDNLGEKVDMLIKENERLNDIVDHKQQQDDPNNHISVDQLQQMKDDLRLLLLKY